MDTITHGIAGALLSKSVFGGRDLLPPTSINKKRLVTWVLMLGAIFPDADVLRDIVSRDPMLMLTWHRSITHSLVCLPVWAVLLAYLTRVVARWRKWEAPSLAALCGLWAIGILSHIFLDLVTDFGTMIWSPVKWSRPAWDLLFIVDFTFAGILLVPQVLAWTFEDPKSMLRRGIILWLVFTPTPLLVAKLAESVGAPTSNTAVILATLLFAVLFLLPAITGVGHRVSYVAWNRAGLVLTICYFVAVTYAHHAAYQRVQQFIASQNLEAKSFAALPYPPSLWHWDGLVLGPRGVYETRIDLSDHLFPKVPGTADANVIERTYYPDALPNPWIDKAHQLRQVQEVLWFARFPVTRFHKEGTKAVVEIVDERFPQLRRDRPPSFMYRVTFGEDGGVISQGWVRP